MKILSKLSFTAPKEFLIKWAATFLLLQCMGLMFFMAPAASASPVGYDLADEGYHTDVLATFSDAFRIRTEHGGSTQQSKSLRPVVYNGHVYVVYFDGTRHPHIAKVPLDGGPIEDEFLDGPGYVVISDSHHFFKINVDNLGYIHVVGDMHGADPIIHWRSDSPEDISSFTKSAGNNNQVPHGYGFTYPYFASDRNGALYYWARMYRGDSIKRVLGMSSYESSNNTWTILGADVPGGVAGQPVTAWENNYERNGYYSLNRADVAFDSNNRMHLAVCLLDVTAPDQGGHWASHILYAYSDDRGQTIYKSDGTPIQWPMRAKSGVYQGEVAYSKTTAPFLASGVKITVDRDDNPVIICTELDVGDHVLRLESGTWVDHGDMGLSIPATPVGDYRMAGLFDIHVDAFGVITARQNGNNVITRFWDPTAVQQIALPYTPVHFAANYCRDHGDLIYTAANEWDTQFRIVRTWISRPGGPVWTADPLVKIDAFEGVDYSDSIVAGTDVTSPNAPITFTKVSGAAWLDVASDGTLTGNPPVGSNLFDNWIIEAKDNLGNTTNVTLTINVFGDEDRTWVLRHGDYEQNTVRIWHMDNTELGNSNPGELDLQDDMAAVPASGRFGQGISGDGALNNPNDRILVTDSATIGSVMPSAPDPSFTVEGWFNLNTGVDQMLFKKNGVATVFQLKYNTAQNYLVLNIGNSGNQLKVGAPGLVNGAWHHIAFSWDADQDRVALYRDGQQIGSADIPGLAVPDAAETLFFAGKVGMPFDGIIDEVRISDVAIQFASVIPGAPLWNNGPIVKNSAASSISYSDSIVLNADVMDPESDLLTFSKISGPAWLNVAADGTLSGVPTAGDLDLNVFVLRADDGTGNTSDATINITVYEGNIVWGSEYSGSDPDTLWIWHMEDTELGNSNPGELYLRDDMAALPAGGRFGQGISGDGALNAANDRMQVSDGATIGSIMPSAPDPSFTVEGWFNLNTGVDQMLFKKKGTATVFQLKYNTAANNLVLNIGNSGNTLTVAAPGLGNGTWHHIAFSWDESLDRVVLYRDGQEIGSAVIPGLAVPDAAETLLFAGVFGIPFDGIIDEVRISDKALIFGTPYYMSWRDAAFTTPTGPNTSRTDDFDTDGFSNEQEYYFGMDPEDSANQTGNQKTIFATVENAGPDYYPAITYSYRTDNPGVTYTIETSPDLVSWSDETSSMVLVGGITDNLDGTETKTLRYNVNFSLLLGGKLFFRVKAME